MSVIAKVLLCTVASVVATKIENVKPHGVSRLVEINSNGDAVNRVVTADSESAEADQQPISHFRDQFGYSKLGQGFCRGNNANDLGNTGGPNGMGWHNKVCHVNNGNTCSQQRCEQMCNNDPTCHGIEYNFRGNCELWHHFPCYTSTQGVQNNNGVCMIKVNAQRTVTHCPAGSPGSWYSSNNNQLPVANNQINQNAGNQFGGNGGLNNQNQVGATGSWPNNQNGGNQIGASGANAIMNNQNGVTQSSPGGFGGANSRSAQQPARSSALGLLPSSAVVTSSAMVWFALA